MAPQPLKLKRLKLDMPPEDIFIEMCRNADGSFTPAPISILEQVLSSFPDPRVGPAFVFFLDCCEIYGTEIWQLYAEVCGGSLPKFTARLQASMHQSDLGTPYETLTTELRAEIKRAAQVSRLQARHSPGRTQRGKGRKSRTWGSLQFVRVPAGPFLMGSKDDNKLAHDNERPQHTVEIPYDYWIARYPVTNEQFAMFIAASGYEFDQGRWQNRANHPVVNVTWHDAMAYSQWLNATLRGELKDLTLRLPTEAEWEKAARGTQGNEWPWGNERDPKKCDSGPGYTTIVGTYSPQGDSPYGAADMAGNVWEWSHSLYKPYPYQANDGRENEADENTRVLRGGSCYAFVDSARCAFRENGPSVERYKDIGLRVIVSPISLAFAKRLIPQ